MKTCKHQVYYEGIIRLSWHLAVGTLIKCILFMTTCNFLCTSLFLSKVVRVQSVQEGYKEMKGHMLWLQLTSDQKYWSRKTAKTTPFNVFYASKLQDHIEEGLLFQNILKPANVDSDHLFLAIA